MSDCPIHGNQWCTCNSEVDPSPEWIKAVSDDILLRHHNDCAVHSPTLKPCSCGLETRMRSELSRLRASLEAMTKEMDEQKQRRVYYQDIVYAVCNEIDSCWPATHVVCGTKESPSTEVQNKIKELISRLAIAVETLEEAEAFIGVMFGNRDGKLPEFVQTPIGVPVQLGEIGEQLRTALSQVRSKP